MPHDKKPPAISGGNEPYEEELRAMGELLDKDAEQIMERWFERANEEQVHTDERQREDAMNDLLEMLQSVGRRLHQKQTSQAMEEADEIARGHGRQRAGLGRSIVDVVNDYEILHGVGLEYLGQALSKRLTYRQAAVLASVIDRAMGSAVEAFSEMAQKRLEKANRQLEEQVRTQQAELRQLTLDLTDAEHRERQQIAQTLHDDFQQILVASRMKLNASLTTPSPNPSAVKEVGRLLDHMLEVSRNVTADLHPTVLERQHLSDALKWLGDTFEQRFDLKVNVEIQVSPESSEGPISLRRLVYDIVRELLFNIVKHAETDEAWLRVASRDQCTWRLEIEDRGVGSAEMESQNVSTGRTSLGLASVRRRIGKIGGTMEVSSEPGRGTRIVLTVPME